MSLAAEQASSIEAAAETATAALVAELGPGGHWTGRLSSSALSTATAIIALAEVDRACGETCHEALRETGLQWLAANVNADGGWGDTDRSKSNISTTALCWAAFGAAGADERFGAVVSAARDWLARAAGSLDALVPAIERRYGEDRTFSIPILMTLALSGRLGPGGWEQVRRLPFELAALPHQLFGALRLPVVSYALPALIAIGQTIHHHRRGRGWSVAGWVRDLCQPATLRVLSGLQPSSGGFLEATPLTSFVTMSLASMGHAGHQVTRFGAEFLRRSARPDGSWPIDTNLSTWVTTLAIKALGPHSEALRPEQKLTLREWLLGQQYRVEHPYTHAAPGGWAWTNLPGGVPDADDTPGVLLALLNLGVVTEETQAAGCAAVSWLLDLQNRDGGIPTFCRGWGALPFDRSSADLTAHALRAWSAWWPQMNARLRPRARAGIARGVRFLGQRQNADGSWLPLWFGNEHAADEGNPVYGTAHVLTALRELRLRGFAVPEERLGMAVSWLTGAQQADGGWGGAAGAPASIEETALAVSALVDADAAGAVNAGAHWLAERVLDGTWRQPAPIGFYFAKLWYYEALYPLIHTVAALRQVAERRRLEA